MSCFLSFYSIAVGVGFYGNSETNDGVYQLTYSLYNTNRTLVGAETLVRKTYQIHSTNSHTSIHYYTSDLNAAFNTNTVRTVGER